MGIEPDDVLTVSVVGPILALELLVGRVDNNYIAVGLYLLLVLPMLFILFFWVAIVPAIAIIGLVIWGIYNTVRELLSKR